MDFIHQVQMATVATGLSTADAALPLIIIQGTSLAYYYARVDPVVVLHPGRSHLHSGI